MSKTTLMPPKLGEPDIHHAARCGLHDEIKALAANNADLNLVFDMNLDPINYQPNLMTPLMVAAGSGDGATAETVKLLLELGADPNYSYGSVTAACIACSGMPHGYNDGGSAEKLRVLLEAGDPLQTFPIQLNREFCNLANNAQLDYLKLLYEFGAEPYGHWDQGNAIQEQLGFQEYIRQNSTLDLGGLSDELRESMEQMNKEMFAQVTSAPSSFEIPLFCAAGSGSKECVSYLLNIGANPLAKDNSNRTALFYAASSEVINLLLESGLSLDDRDEFGWPPIGNAVSAGVEGIEKVKALIDCGADVNATFDQGYTVFMAAASDSSRNVEMLKLLIDAGANPHAISELNYNVFHAAIDVNFEANSEESVRSVLTYLKSLNVDLEAVNNRRQTPLTRAVCDGTGIETQVVCELGANVNYEAPMMVCGEQSCDWPELALIFHASIGTGVYLDIKTEALLRAGANPLVTNAGGFTALDMTVSQLCGASENYEVLFRDFYDNFPDTNTICNPLTNSANTYAIQVEKTVRDYVEEYAERIPLEGSADYVERHRAEMIGALTWLSIYTHWYQGQNG